MLIDRTNTNLIWTSILVETLYRLGLTTAIVCPGSRSAPLAIAVANHSQIEAIPVLDERSASFFALGLARQQQRPVVLICTSGTAGANFYPAVIEARESRVPLLILTADRPPELRECHAGQAIDQQKLYGTFPNWYAELAIPSLEPTLLAYLRQTLVHAWHRALAPVPGVVHLNLPFREPLAPIPEPHTPTFTLDLQDFFSALSPSPPLPVSPSPSFPLPNWQPATRGIIIAGAAQPASPETYCQAIADLSTTLGFPVLADGLSPVRNHADRVPNLVAPYDLILRNSDLATKLAPETVIRIGEMPTSKQLRSWLTATNPHQWIIDPGGRNLDPLHGKTCHLPISVEALATLLPTDPAPASPYLELWNRATHDTQQSIDQTLSQMDRLFEGKVAWMLSQVLPAGTPLFISNSTPIRDVEWFWRSNNSRVQPFFNRGANGIDGSLSTALGIAHRQVPAVMLTGDLALLHDTNGFLIRQFAGHLTIVLINNEGGGIFELLPIAQFNPPFEEFFATPQAINFAQLCQTYGVKHERISQWSVLKQRLNPLPTSGIRILEIGTDRHVDANWRKNNLNTFAANVPLHPHDD